jgi:tyrosine-specific transport protein
MLFNQKHGSVLGGTLLITATTIGVGMLALPIATGKGGFIPSIAIYFICWLFMLCTGLLFLEVCLWAPKNSNLISMSRKLLGPVGQGICWILYLFLFITVMIAHVSGGGEILESILGSGSNWIASIGYVLIFSPVAYLGAKTVNKLNAILFIGVIISYLLFISFSHSHIDFNLLKRTNWPKAILGFPVLFTAFTYQLIIPTLTAYLEKNIRKIRLSIFFGTTIPLIIYLVWETLILSILPKEALYQAYKEGQNAVQPLQAITGNSALFQIGKAFAFFTLTTSYIALVLAFIDFLADGLNVSKKGINKIALCLLVLVPPTLISITYPHLFLTALSYAGGYSCAILFGLFPPLMVWVGRYQKKFSKDHPRQLFGDKPLLCFLILLVSLEVTTQIFHDSLTTLLK